VPSRSIRYSATDVTPASRRASETIWSPSRCGGIVGPDVLSYGEMLDLMADALGGRRRPPGAGAAHHAVAVFAVDRTCHPGGRGSRPPARGGPFDTDHIVSDSSAAELFVVHPMPFMDALRKALDEDHEAPARRGERLGRGGAGTSCGSARLTLALVEGARQPSLASTPASNASRALGVVRAG
jgi:hypothetical protein